MESAMKKRRLDVDPDPESPHEFQSNEELLFNDTTMRRTECQYGTSCYRKNPEHFMTYRHSDLESLFIQMRKEGDSCATAENLASFADKDVLVLQLEILRQFRLQTLGREDMFSTSSTTTASPVTFPSPSSGQQQSKKINPSPARSMATSEHPSTSSNSNLRNQIKKPPSTGMLAKLEASHPFNFFLTKIPSESSSASLSVTFQELFHPTLGKVKAVCHFNFMVEAEWLLDQTLQSNLDDAPVTVFCGVPTSELQQATEAFPWLKVYAMKSPFPFGHHHTKMTFIKYDDNSLRFIVYTANLIEEDWSNRTQGVWIGPRCPLNRNEDGEVGDSVTNFRSDLIQYLNSYPAKYLGTWISDIQSCDCSEIRVAFVGSSPVTSTSSSNGFNLGLKQMDKLLRNSRQYVAGSDWPLVIQCSSIATMGPNDEWLRTELAANMIGSPQRNTFPICLIYPSQANVKDSPEGIEAGGCLPYRQLTHERQPWIQNILYQWKSDSRQRTKAMPHIKTYCRVSPDRTKLAWFLLTSANLSKSAWGKLNKNRDRLTVMSWEAGVLFIPKYFTSSGQDTFTVSKNPGSNTPGSGLEFPVPYDFPLTKYTSNDKPWFMDLLVDSKR